MEQRKQNIINALEAWVDQKPCLSFADYGDNKYYQQDYRGILQAKHDFYTILRQVELRDSLTADDLIKGFDSFSGRLSIAEDDDQNIKLDYCTGQYWPTEYRSAACAVVASALWAFWRSDLEGLDLGNRLHKMARDQFGIGIAKRWFN